MYGTLSESKLAESALERAKAEAAEEALEEVSSSAHFLPTALCALPFLPENALPAALIALHYLLAPLAQATARTAGRAGGFSLG